MPEGSRLARPWFRPDTWVPPAIAVIAFMLVFGPSILRPTYLGWLAFGDAPPQQFGWMFLREQPWGWPLGALARYGKDFGGSIVYTDSIPLMAIPFKLLSPLLPQPFQYFGLWFLVCLVAQAHFAWKLLRLFITAPLLLALGTSFFVMTPVMLWRMNPLVSHMSLGGQFTILAALYLVLRKDDSRSWRHWSLLLAATTAIHAYLLAMCAAFWLADLVARRRTRHTSLDALQWIGVPAIAVLVVAWTTGYFTVPKGITGAGYGFFKAHPLALIDPGTPSTGRWSWLLPDVPWEKVHVEGFNFLGLGLLLLIAILGLKFRATLRLAARSAVHRPWLAGTLALMAVFALSNKIGSYSTFVQVPLPEAFMQLAEVFRSSGRMLWPLVYALTLAVLVTVSRRFHFELAVGLLAATLVVQVVDTSAGWRQFQRTYAATANAAFLPAPEGSFWDVAATRYRTIRSIPATGIPDGWGTIAAFALQSDMSTNAVYLARLSRPGQAAESRRIRSYVQSGCYPADALFLVQPESAAAVRRTLHSESDLLITVNDLLMLAPGWYGTRDCQHD